jgi:hypothetical protein
MNIGDKVSYLDYGIPCQGVIVEKMPTIFIVLNSKTKLKSFKFPESLTLIEEKLT